MIVAWSALILWPIVGLVLYSTLPFAMALSAVLIGGYLLLPTQVAFDLPLLPPLDKHTIPALTALVMAIVAAQRTTIICQPGWLPRSRVARILLGVLVIGAIGTALTNTDPVVLADRRLPGLRPYDIFSIGLAVVMMLIPFFLGRKFLAGPETQQSFLLVLVLAAVGYAFLALWEIRMSPQLNSQIYGFFPHSWRQHIRGGGFRPLVFLEHGLWLAIFFTSATVAAITMARQRSRWQLIFAFSGLWLFLTLALSKSLGALMIACLLAAVALILPRRFQLLSAVSIAFVVLLYPTLRAVDLIPTDTLTAAAARIDTQRAASLEFRFANENLLLERSAAKPVFGWGGWGRNRVYNEKGDSGTVTDGYWVILFGQGGWVRYLGEFGLMTLGGLALFFRRRDALHPAAIAIALALSANLLDLLVNAGLSPLTWLMAGALVGALEERSLQDTPHPAEAMLDRSQRYRRNLAPSSQTPSPEPAHPKYARTTTPHLRRDRE